MSQYLPQQYVKILASHVDERPLKVQYGEITSVNRKIAAGVPQESVFGPLLYILFTADIPNHPETTTAMSAVHTALVTISSCPLKKLRENCKSICILIEKKLKN